MRRRKRSRQPKFKAPVNGFEKFALATMMHFRDLDLDRVSCQDCEDRKAGVCNQTKDVFFCMSDKARNLEVMSSPDPNKFYIRDERM